MPKYIDRTNTEINGIVFIRRAENTGKKVKWVCRCTCGNEFIAYANHIQDGRKCQKCGRKSQANKVSKHHDYKTPLYSVWLAMRQRCGNPNSKSYRRYGGRGISVCSEWKEWNVFKEWALSNGYSLGLSIDRIDNDGNYEPNNCRWVTNEIQANNKSDNHLITFNGETASISVMARKYGYLPTDIERRILEGWTVEKALTTPVKRLN